MNPGCKKSPGTRMSLNSSNRDSERSICELRYWWLQPATHEYWITVTDESAKRDEKKKLELVLIVPSSVPYHLEQAAVRSWYTQNALIHGGRLKVLEKNIEHYIQHQCKPSVLIRAGQRIDMRSNDSDLIQEPTHQLILSLTIG